MNESGIEGVGFNGKLLRMLILSLMIFTVFNPKIFTPVSCKKLE